MCGSYQIFKGKESINEFKQQSVCENNCFKNFVGDWNNFVNNKSCEKFQNLTESYHNLFELWGKGKL